MAASTNVKTYEIKCIDKDRITRKEFVRQTIHAKVPEWYTVASTRALGWGASGVVFEATDTRTNKRVAIKHLRGFYTNPIDCMRVLREIKLLRICDHPNIIKLFDIFPVDPSEEETFDTIYLVFEFMRTDLKHVIKNNGATLTEEHFSSFMYQMFKGLKYLDSAGILHRDLKPENILLDEDSNLKIADLGLARFISDSDKPYTEYVVTRYYRAPEVICDRKSYSTKVDLWSAGTILAEMILRRVFLVGNDQVQQLALILMNTGSPTAEEIEHIKDVNARRYVEKCVHHDRPDFHDLFPDASEDAVDLLEHLLRWNPDDRLSLDECLNHPFVAQWKDADSETVFEGPDESLIWEFEDQMENLSVAERRKLFLEEIKYWERKHAQE